MSRVRRRSVHDCVELLTNFLLLLTSCRFCDGFLFLLNWYDKKKTHNELNSSKRKIGNTGRGSRMSRLRFLLCFSTSAFSLLYFSVRYTKTQVIPEQRQERRGLFVNVIKLLDQCYYDNILHIVRLYTFVWFIFSQDLIRSVNSTFHTDKYVQIYSRLCNYIHCVHITHSRSNTNILERGCLFVNIDHKAVSSVRR